MRCYDRLCIVTESISDKSHSYLLGVLRRDVLRICKTYDVVDSLDRSFPRFIYGFVVTAARIMLIDQLHLQVGVMRVRGAVYGGCKQHTVGLFGVEYVGYAFVYRGVNRF